MLQLLLTIAAAGASADARAQRTELNEVDVDGEEFSPDQYHIQTDEGDERFFKYQTWGGQFRKESRLEDGAVVGSYGWVDANNVLRVTDYVADAKGYRIVRTRAIKLGRKRKRKKKLLDHRGGLDDNVIEPLKVTRPPPEPFTATRPPPTSTFGPAPTRHPRLQRRIGSGGKTVAVQPLFDFTPAERENEGPFIDNAPQRKAGFGGNFKVQARGEGSRTRYDPRAGRVRIDRPERQRSGGGGGSGGSGGRVVHFPSGPGVVRGGPVAGRTIRRNGRRFKVVKRRRKPDPSLARRDSVIDYQTGKAFHRESEPGPDGRRRGEYGYIDPLGVRRVVTYDTGPGGGELERGKENDFVGDNTYFESV